MGNTPGKRKSDGGGGSWYSMGEYSVNLMDKLGQGSYGVVYRGKEKKSGKTIAIKQIKISQEGQGSMALAEIKNLKKLPQHPNLVQYRGYHFHSDSFWVAMEFCDMGDLSEYYKKHYPERVPLAHQVHFMYQISSSVTHLHSLASPIIHRDIKPANVMLCRNRHGYPIVKLTDFGISKISEEGVNPASTYMMSTIAGTPMYMAPEFFTGENPSYGRRIDVFAMGMLFLTMLQAEHGKPLLSPRTEDVSGAKSKFPIGMRMCMAHATHGPPIKLVEIKASDPPCIKQVKRLIPQMCESDPHKRPKAASLTDALGQCLESVKSALEPDFLEGTSSGLWLVSSMSGTDQMAERKRASASAPESAESSGSSGTAEAVAYMLIQEALKSQMADKVRKQEEQEQLESMPLMELLRLVAGPSQREEVDRFQPGELVRIDNDLRRVKELQEGYGGWVSGMEKYLGKSGKVQRKVLHVYKVKFGDGVELSFNPEVLQKLEGADQFVAGLAHALEEVIHDASDPVSRKFSRFTVVEVIDDADKLEELQTKEHGGFSSKMILACGVRGIVNRVKDGSVYVEMINGDNWYLNPAALTVVDTDDVEIEEGDFVVISNMEDKVKAKQQGHGGWNPAMEKALGSAGIVKAVGKSRNVAEVETTGRTWLFNMDILRHVARGEDLFAAIMKKRLVSILLE